MSDNSREHSLKSEEIGFCTGQGFPGIVHFCRGDHVHRTGDFHCALDTVDPVSDFSC